MRGREGAEPKQRRAHRDIRLFRELRDFALGAGEDDAVTGENHGAFGLIDQGERFVEFLLRREKSPALGGARLGAAASQSNSQDARLRVLGDVHQHRAGPVGSGDQKGLAQARGDVLGAGDQIVVLGDGEGDAGDVASPGRRRFRSPRCPPGP